MKNQTPFYALLAIAGGIDAWLLAHPNLMGKLGIWMYKYDMLKTVPRAFGTVFAVLIVCLFIGYLAKKKLSKIVGMAIVGVFLAASLWVLIDTYFKFSEGTYAMTGAGFKTGALLLPVLMAIVFGKTLGEILQKK